MGTSRCSTWAIWTSSGGGALAAMELPEHPAAAASREIAKTNTAQVVMLAMESPTSPAPVSAARLRSFRRHLSHSIGPGAHRIQEFLPRYYCSLSGVAYTLVRAASRLV